MSLTAGERTALRWLLAVAGVGAGVQLTRHWRHSADATPLAAESLTRQLIAVDSAQRAARGSTRRTTASRSGRTSRQGTPGVSQAGADNGEGRVRRRSSAATLRPILPEVPVDVDRADSASLERLPRIGPALAARIVADRNRLGPFGSIEGLQRVRGIGPRLGDALRGHVTFSGTPRPSPVQR